MLTSGSLLAAGRWKVAKPFAQANSRNFCLWRVKDKNVENREALLKTVRKTDMPSPELYAWRRRALQAEYARCGVLSHAAMPEPLDCFETLDGELAIVYALIGQDRGSLMLLDKQRLYGFTHGTNQNNNEYLAIDQIAVYMQQVADFTQSLWEQGFVHTNLHLNHLYILKGIVLRVVGQSAICRWQANTAGALVIVADEPGLRNLAAGYQSLEHRQSIIPGTAAHDFLDLDAARVRWYSYAMLCLELLRGGNIGEYLFVNNALSIDDILTHLEQDCPSLYRGWRSAQGQWPALHRHLGDLFELIKQCLNWNGQLPNDLHQRFATVWRSLNNPDLTNALPITATESRLRRWGPRLNEQPRTRTPETSTTLMVLAHEKQHPPENPRFSKYQAVDVDLSSKTRDLTITLQTRPNQVLFWPGDLVLAKYYDHVTCNPVGWLTHITRLRDGQMVRALSLGRRSRPNVALPWALVDIDGTIQPVEIKPTHSKRQYIIYPKAGVFFDALFNQNQRGVVPSFVPDAAPLRGTRHRVTIHHMVVGEQDFAIFDIPLGKEHMVSCSLPRKCWPVDTEIKQGIKIPIIVDSVKDGNIYTLWDDRAGLIEGNAYEGMCIEANPKRPAFSFGPKGIFRGKMDLISLTWGVPIHTWQQQQIPIQVRVSHIGIDQAPCDLEYAGPRLNVSVPDAFPVGAIVQGRLLKLLPFDRSQERIRLLLCAPNPDPMHTVEAVGVIPFLRVLTNAELRDWTRGQARLRELFPHDADIPVRIERVDADNRLIYVERV